MILSIRLMTYNHEDFIEEALKGIDAQITDFNFEVVIGDDFSTDNNLNIINNYKFTNKNITVNILNRKIGDEYWIKRQKLGRFYNIVNILQNCKGRYIALLDGDDYWTDPYKLQKQVDFLESNKDYFFVSSNSKYHIKNKPFVTHIDGDVCIEDFANGNKLGRNTSAYLFRNKNLDEFCDYLMKDQWPFADLLLGIWCLNYGKGMILDKVMSYYRIHGQGIWSSTPQKQRGKQLIVFYSLLFKSEINRNYDYFLYIKSIDWVFNRVINHATSNFKNIPNKNHFSFNFFNLKKIVKKVISKL